MGKRGTITPKAKHFQKRVGEVLAEMRPSLEAVMGEKRPKFQRAVLTAYMDELPADDGTDPDIDLGGGQILE